MDIIPHLKFGLYAPKRIFIVPYRNREGQKEIFLSHMNRILDEEYEILFIHQKDKRKFNRGAMKNIGYIYVKKMWPQEWENITLIFHDIDCLPYKKIFDYDTKRGIVKHFYGFKFALGGIFAIKGFDFEKVGGFPNYWGWGFEDNKIQDNWKKIGGEIDYSQFLFYTNPKVVKLDSSNKEHELRTVGVSNLKYAQMDKAKKSGHHTLYDIKYSVRELSDKVKMVDVSQFLTERREKKQRFKKNVTTKMVTRDLRRRQRRRRKHQVGFSMNFLK